MFNCSSTSWPSGYLGRCTSCHRLPDIPIVGYTFSWIPEKTRQEFSIVFCVLIRVFCMLHLNYFTPLLMLSLSNESCLNLWDHKWNCETHPTTDDDIHMIHMRVLTSEAGRRLWLSHIVKVSTDLFMILNRTHSGRWFSEIHWCYYSITFLMWTHANLST